MANPPPGFVWREWPSSSGLPSGLPTTVAIGPVDYSVRLDTDAISAARELAEDNRWAQTDTRFTQITLDARLSEARKRETLIHECIHALLYEWNVNLGELPEEPLVESLGNAVLALVRDNPQLIDYCVAK